jgi:lysophospholipase
MNTAPFFDDVAQGPPNGAAHWVHAADGVRLRIGHWTVDKPKGTVLIFPGRTEYVEKYHHAAQELAQRGYASAAIDWRGQGIADRLTSNPAVGHVGQFSDYQLDVAAYVDHARALGLPEPYYLACHSMGGCIGLRALLNGLPVQAVCFTAPMWGIQISSPLRPLAWGLGLTTGRVGLGHIMSPGQATKSYVINAPFEDNTLTRDPAMFQLLKDQLAAHPELGLGGPSMHWIGQALSEMRTLSTLPSPNVPVLTFLGGNERIVDSDRIKSRMARWDTGRLHLIPGAEHEVMMEKAPIATRVFDGMTALFDETVKVAEPA